MEEVRLGAALEVDELRDAIEKKDLAKAQLLLNSGNINHVFSDGKTPLILAIGKKYNPIFDYLLTFHELELSKAESNGATPLIYAAHYDNIHVVQSLLARGVPIDEAMPSGKTSLMAATYHGHEDLVALLLANRAEVNMGMARKRINVDGIEGDLTALMLAASAGHSRIVTSLLEAGADKNIATTLGRSAESIAKYNGHGGLAIIIAEYGRYDDFTKIDDDSMALLGDDFITGDVERADAEEFQKVVASSLAR